MKLPDIHIKDREHYAKWVFGVFLILLAYRWHSGAFVYYVFKQPMKGPELDHSFWISLCAGFPHYIVQHFAACVLVDTAVVVLSIACLFSAKHRVWLCRLLILCFFVQRITVETFSCSHSKSISCVFIAVLPFCFKDDENFNLLVEAGRYLLCFVMVCSAFFKFNNGELMHCRNFAAVLVNQHSDLAILHPSHISYRIALPLINNPAYAAIAYIALFLTQLVFTIGFFTKSFDRILFVFLFIFAVATYLVMRIYNYDIIVLGLSFLYFPLRSMVKNYKEVS